MTDGDISQTNPPLEPLDDPLLNEQGELSSWPKVIGVISLIYAIGGMLCQVSAIGWMFFSTQLMAMGGITVEMPQMVKLTGAISAVLTLPVGLVLLVGAVKLLKRQRSAVTVIKRWVILRMLVLFVGVVLGFVAMPANIQFQREIQEATNQQARENGRSDMVKEFDENAATRNLMIGIAASTTVIAIYPVFLGFYLGRKKINEEVEHWI